MANYNPGIDIFNQIFNVFIQKQEEENEILRLILECLKVTRQCYEKGKNDYEQDGEETNQQAEY